MAGALRPVVVLMVVASALFVVDGWLDGAYPGGDGWIGGPAYHGLGVLAYIFAIINAAIALVIARGSERTLLGRIGLSAFFLAERPLTAYLLGEKPPLSVGVHLATAVVELVILLGALRVWRLGRSIEEPDMNAAFALDAPSPAAPEADDAVGPGLPQSTSWMIGSLTILLAAALVADGIIAGFVPGGKQWGTAGDAAGWVVYLFSVVALTVALPAVHGRTLALRVLLALALILFIERAFSPFALRMFEPVGLALHVFAAFIALALALLTVSAIRARAATARLSSSQAGRA